MKSKIKTIRENLFQRNFKDLKNSKNYTPRTYKELQKILQQKSFENDANLNDIDVSNLKEIGGFSEFKFFKHNNFYLDEWNVSNALTIENCFSYCHKFNSDISNWDVSNVKSFESVFIFCFSFNSDVNKWDTRNGERFDYMFCATPFNRELYNFKVKNKIDRMFLNATKFNQDISNWDVSKVKNFAETFAYAKRFKQDLSGWDVSNAVDWYMIFDHSGMENHPELWPERFRRDYFGE